MLNLLFNPVPYDGVGRGHPINYYAYALSNQKCVCIPRKIFCAQKNTHTLMAFCERGREPLYDKRMHVSFASHCVGAQTSTSNILLIDE